MPNSSKLVYLWCDVAEQSAVPLLATLALTAVMAIDALTVPPLFPC